MGEQSVKLAVAMDFLRSFEKNRNGGNTRGWKGETLERALGSEAEHQRGLGAMP